ncbi:histidinol dehydrogenase, partial [Klebsiella pneumoniae]|uniref:histidinol dehydrogenase n=1 Tax=Klebsiella pneumoniae TaxID=573 RepID=UPI00210DF20A
MHKLSQALSDIEVDCSVLECEGEPCLFVNLQDEFAATCSSLGLADFQKRMTVQELSRDGFAALASTIEILAAAERL